MQGYICEGYAPAKYVMGEEGGVKQLPKKKEDLIRERWGKWAFYLSVRQGSQFGILRLM